jgi:hypothetical protein
MRKEPRSQGAGWAVGWFFAGAWSCGVGGKDFLGGLERKFWIGLGLSFWVGRKRGLKPTETDGETTYNRHGNDMETTWKGCERTQAGCEDG